MSPPTDYNKSVEGYEIREAKVNEKLKLVSFLEKHFFPQEYLLSSYLAAKSKEIDKEEEAIIAEDLRVMHEFMLATMPCLVAVHRQTKAIVGINLMTMMDNREKPDNCNLTQTSTFDCANDDDDDDEEEEESIEAGRKTIESPPPPPPIRSALLAEWFESVLDKADERFDFFNEFPKIERMLKLIIVCVDQKHGGKGIATALMAKTLDWAKDKQIGLVHGLFTSAWSRKAAEKIGFQNYATIDAKNLRDSKGDFIYPHIDSYVISLMALTL